MDINKIYKALASPIRRDILAWLKAPSTNFDEEYVPFLHGVSAGQIHERCALSKSTVSTHLAILHDAELVTSLRVGQWIFFKRNEDVVNAFLNEVTQHL
ncbi:ArsR/SmtB family transcription factor [Paraburkholderia sp. GAS334]|uniref:ArsR/SmtB family transcription factor n=1 Tax=Paraburkholderia sp. GAS334 TaxID=3035131 RepID=UPI003D25EBC6